ncbi:MAG: DNA polymerase domain-containing protein [Candidatus Hodarchaeales archaeon]
MLLDCDYTMLNKNELPLIHLWGKQGQRRVEIQVEGFLPYFYVETKKKNVQTVIETGNKALKSWIIEISEEKRTFYFGGKKSLLTKVVGRVPFQVPKIRSIFEQKKLKVIEADIPFAKRFLIDQNLRALHHISVKGEIVRENSSEIVLKTDYHNVYLNEVQSTGYEPIALAFDIEVDYDGETIQELISAKKRRITAISFAWEKMGVDVPKSYALILKEDSDLAEKKILLEFINRVNDIAPDILVSFNGTFFDIPYLQGRMLKYGLSLASLALFPESQNDIYKIDIPVEGYRLRGRGVVDLIRKSWGIHPLSGKKNLDTIASILLGENKVPLKKPLGELWRSSIAGNSEDADVFYDYSLKDSILTFRLASELGVPNSVELCRLTGYVLPEGLLSTHRNIGEFELMRILNERGILIPKKPNKTELARRNALNKKFPHLGGWVIDPTVNEALFVAILDFKSLYPNIVRQYNISGETLIPNSGNKKPEKRFYQAPKGAFADLMDKILNERYTCLQSLELAKKDQTNSNKQKISYFERKQKSLKLCANSLCGAANYPRGRFHSALLANSITGIARDLIGERLQDWTIEFSKTHKYNVEVRYGDTDSIFCEFLSQELQPTDFLPSSPKDIRNKNLKILENLIHEYQIYLINKLPDFLELKLEDIALRIILKKGRKKSYSYLSIYSGKVIIKGFEAVRSDWSPLAKKTQRLLLETLLMDFSESRIPNVRQMVVRTCRFILKSPVETLIDELSIRGPLKRSPRDYKTRTPAVGAFINYCKSQGKDPETEWKHWDGFPYIIAKGSSKQPQFLRAYHPDVFREKIKQIDRFHYIKEILGASNRFGIDLKEIEALKGRFIIPLTEFF